MKKISYAGESFVTTDGVADALVRFVAALGANHTSAAVEVPALSESNSVEIVQLVVGPSSAMVSRPVPLMQDEVTEATQADMSSAAARLNAGTEALTVPRHVVYAEPHGTGGYDFEGLELL